MRVDHIGYAVRSISSARAFLELLGFSVASEEILDEAQRSRIQFLTSGGLKVELIEPISDDSPTVQILRRLGPLPYHLCFVSEDFDGTLERLKARAILVVDGVPAKAFGGRRVAFFYSKEIGLFEVLEGEIIGEKGGCGGCYR